MIEDVSYIPHAENLSKDQLRAKYENGKSVVSVGTMAPHTADMFAFRKDFSSAEDTLMLNFYLNWRNGNYGGQITYVRDKENRLVVKEFKDHW